MPYYCAVLSHTSPRVDAVLFDEHHEWAPCFANAWAMVAEDFGERSLQDILFEPVARVLAGHPTLLKELLEATPEDHPDYEDVEQAIVVWERLGKECLNLLPTAPAPESEPVRCDSGYESESEDEDETF
jgi:hypothetical protein